MYAAYEKVKPNWDESFNFLEVAESIGIPADEAEDLAIELAQVDGLSKNPVDNKPLLDQLREIEPGKWRKVYKDWYDASGNRISVHYCESPSGKVFDVDVKPGWSNKWLKKTN